MKQKSELEGKNKFNVELATREKFRIKLKLILLLS